MDAQLVRLKLIGTFHRNCNRYLNAMVAVMELSYGIDCVTKVCFDSLTKACHSFQPKDVLARVYAMLLLVVFALKRTHLKLPQASLLLDIYMGLKILWFHSICCQRDDIMKYLITARDDDTCLLRSLVLTFFMWVLLLSR